MSSETLYLRRHAAHLDRHTPHLCSECSAPLTANGRCTRCERIPAEHRTERFPDPRARLERMERAVYR